MHFFFISYKFTLFISPNKLRAFVLGEHDDKNLFSDTKEHEFFRSIIVLIFTFPNAVVCDNTSNRFYNVLTNKFPQ